MIDPNYGGLSQNIPLSVNNLLVVSSSFYPRAEIVISSERYGCLNVGRALDLGHKYWDESLSTGDSRIIVNITITIAVFPCLNTVSYTRMR